MSDRRRFIACVLAYHLLLHCEINVFSLCLAEMSGPSHVLCAWKSISKEIIACYLCEHNQKAQTGELEPFPPFSLLSLTVKCENCEVLLLCSATVAANTNKNINTLQVLQVGLPDLKFMTGLPVLFRNMKSSFCPLRSDTVPAALSF